MREVDRTLGPTAEAALLDSVGMGPDCQIRPVQQRLIPQLVPQIVAEVPILASGAQVAEKAQDRMQTPRIEEQARPHRPGRARPACA